MSSPTGARVRLGSFGGSASDACSAPIEVKSSAVLRHCSTLIGSKVWLSSAWASSVSNGGQRPVVQAAVASGASCAARDLRELRRIEPAELVAVVFAVGGEGDVIDVEIEPHADGIGGDEIFDVARLIELNLRVAGPRRERTHDDGSAAALAADQFRDLIDLFGGKRDHRRTPGQPCELLLAAEGELRQPRAGQHMGAGQEVPDHRANGLRAEHQRPSRPRRLSMRSVKT
jgi:hypothetical protein